MTEPTNRRAFFRLLAGEGVRGAREVAPLLTLPAGGSWIQDDQRRGRVPTVAVPVAQRCLTRDELHGLIADHGLRARRAEVQAAAITSLRLVPVDSMTASYIAAGGAVPATTLTAGSSGRRTSVLAHIDLGDVARAGAAMAADLPSQGALQLLWAYEDAPAGASLSDAGSAAVLIAAESAGRRRRRRLKTKPRGTRHAQVAAELSLPRAWTQTVSEFGLSLDECEAWERLRLEVAARQGVERSLEQDGPAVASLHRLFGYPDEREGHMPSMCEAAARGIELGNRPVYEHPAAEELEAASSRWRLLFQLSLDDALGWEWGPGRARLYVWIPGEDLGRGDFSRVWAITQ